jgi:hypothetical protein
MIVFKVKIDELVQLLSEIRKETEFVDIQLETKGILRVRKHVQETTQPEDTDNMSDLNQLIG